MEQILLLVLVLAVFLVPAIAQMRRQQRQLSSMKALQDALNVGDRVVTSSGIHGAVVALRPSEIDLELSPGVVTTWERVAVLRVVHAEQEETPNTQPGDQAESDSA